LYTEFTSQAVAVPIADLDTDAGIATFSHGTVSVATTRLLAHVLYTQLTSRALVLALAGDWDPHTSLLRGRISLISFRTAADCLMFNNSTLGVRSAHSLRSTRVLTLVVNTGVTRFAVLVASAAKDADIVDTCLSGLTLRVAHARQLALVGNTSLSFRTIF